MKRGAIPVEESLKLALQIAEALEAAHEKGVIHRDLKPANIKVTPDGKIKVLDFGLAKAFAGDGSDANLSQSPTLSMAATQKGVILGTAAYMSPEQASGDSTDKRADIWSFGVVLFEMVTGRQTFDGKTVAHVLADVLRAEPEWNRLPPNLHPRLRLLLERCLEKEARDRCHDIADVRVDVQKVLADPDGVIVQPVVEAAQVATPSKLPWIAALVVVAVVAGVGGWTLRPAETVSVSRFDYDLPEGINFTTTVRQVVAISPDGRQFVYRGTGGFYLRAMDGLEAQMIAGIGDANLVDPVFSPDGQQIVYVDFPSISGRLMKVAVTGGAPTVLTEPVGPTFGISWETNETILYGQPDGIWQVSENGGTPVQLISAEEGEQAFGPQLLPGGEWVLFTLARPTGTGRWDEADIVIESLSSGERRVLRTGGSDARYVATGHLVYALEDALFALRFDVEALELSGGPVSILQGVRRSRNNTGAAFYSFSDSGTLVYVPGSGGLSAERTAVWVDRKGVATSIATIPTGGYGRPRISPDGGRLLIWADEDLWNYEIASGRRSAVTTDGLTNDYTAWSLDGSQVAYSSSRSGGAIEAWIQPADGSGEAKQLTTDSDGNVHVDSWSPIGEVLAVHQHGGNVVGILMIPQPNADATPQPFVDEEQVSVSEAQFSPDGRFVAYLSTRTGENQVYVRPYPGPGAPEIVSVDGGVEPIWGANGELFYRHPVTHAMMSVAVSTEPTLTVGVPELLFNAQEYVGYTAGSPRAWFDVARDGQQFLMIRDAGTVGEDGSSRSQINIILNWFEELKERVPVP